jgi:purine-binding chemotaxis protein CheW
MNDEARLAPLEPETDFADLLDGEPVEEASPEHQFCVFRAGRERFCLPVLDVEEVVDWPLVTRLPLAPPYLLGIFNLRGSVVPLVDIAFTEARRPGLLPKQVVVASLRDPRAGEDIRIGIAADEVVGTHLVSEPLVLEAAPSELPHCRGMLRHDDRLALALDLRRLIQVFPAPAI